MCRTLLGVSPLALADWECPRWLHRDFNSIWQFDNQFHFIDYKRLVIYDVIEDSFKLHPGGFRLALW